MCFYIRGNLIYHGKYFEKEELEKQKNKIKAFLDGWEHEQKEVVALSMKRTPSLLVTIFALLEEGIPFLPLDTNLPEERLKYMLDKAEVKTIITDEKKWNEFCGRTTLCITEHTNFLEELYQPIRENKMKQELAYLLFTSGTTGLPKAVEIRRKGLKNFVRAIPQIVDFPKESRIACFTSYTFDIFFLESVMALYEGMTVVLADEEERSNPRRMQELIRKEKINVIQMTPSALRMLQMIDEKFTCLNEIETIMVGGEVFPKQLLKSLQKAVKGRIYNMYGPTETTIWSMVAELTRAEKVHIGQPIKDTQICILNENLEEVPQGQEGEIGIIGIGLARGYRNELEKTKENFVFINRNGIKQRVYRTGDYGFLSNTGDYIFCGRKDNQVKILGHRIEIDDIEENVIKISGIQNAMVAVYGDDIKRLVCFYVSEDSLNEGILREKAKKYLPEYMVPSKWIWVSELLFTASNKADRNAMIKRYLKACNLSNNSAVRTEVEDEIFRVVKESLGLEKEEIQLADSIEEYVLDSLGYIQLVVAIEDYYNIEFADEMLSIQYFQNFEELVDYVAAAI